MLSVRPNQLQALTQPSRAKYESWLCELIRSDLPQLAEEFGDQLGPAVHFAISYLEDRHIQEDVSLAVCVPFALIFGDSFIESRDFEEVYGIVTDPSVPEATRVVLVRDHGKALLLDPERRT